MHLLILWHEDMTTPCRHKTVKSPPVSLFRSITQEEKYILAVEKAIYLIFIRLHHSHTNI